jgi:hypothetical protein
MKKGKTMTATLIHVIWDLPVVLFNTVREKIAKNIAQREDEEGRWLNG